MAIKKIIILGATGGCLDLIDLIESINKIKKKYKIVGFLEDTIKKNSLVSGYKILGKFKDIKILNKKDIFFAIGIGSAKNFLKTEKIINDFQIKKAKFLTLIHPNSSISRNSTIGVGCNIFQNCTVSRNVIIKNFVNVLPLSFIGHDSILQDFVKINSGVIINSKVIIKKKCYVASGVEVKEGVTIEESNLIGMSTLVLKNINIKKNIIYNKRKFYCKVNK